MSFKCHSSDHGGDHEGRPLYIEKADQPSSIYITLHEGGHPWRANTDNNTTKRTHIIQAQSTAIQASF